MLDNEGVSPDVLKDKGFTASRRSFLKASAISGGLLMAVGVGSAGQAIAEPNTTAGWTASDIPTQLGRTIIITGGNGLRLNGMSGIGYEDARALAGAGATVIIASRNAQRGAAAIDQIRQVHPDANIRFETLDLTDLASVEAFADRVRSTHQSVDTLINNAAIMAPPQRAMTIDGFERQLATNYLGHFALTAHLLPLLRQGNAPRVVNMASLAANAGSINFDDLQAERHYDAFPVYAQSKLAQMMFAFELQRRSDAAGWGLRAVAAHPGISRTNLIPTSMAPDSEAVRRFIAEPELSQPAEQGALPPLYAATADAVPGGYYGPTGPEETRGFPGPAAVPAQATDTAVAARLWDTSMGLTDASFG